MKIKHNEEKKLLSHYNKHPDYYSPLDHNNLDHIISKLTGSSPEQIESVLDMGCGDGRLSQYFQTAEYVGVDYSEVRIKKAKKTFEEATFEQCDINLFECNRKFDVVCFFEVLEHLKEPKEIIDRFRVVGTVIGTVPIDMPYKAHLQVFKTKKEVEKRLNVNVIITGKKHFFFTTK